MESNFIQKESNSVYCVHLKKEFYEREAVMTAAESFANQCYIKIDALPDGYVGVWFKLKYEINDEKVQQLLGEFCNEVLDCQVRLDLEKRYGSLRETIYQYAFQPISKT